MPHRLIHQLLQVVISFLKFQLYFSNLSFGHVIDVLRHVSVFNAGGQQAVPIGFENIPYPSQQPAESFQGAYPGPPPPRYTNYATPGTTTVVTTVPTSPVLLLGGCPACRVTSSFHSSV